MTLAELQAMVHGVACSKGWWDKDRDFPEVIALIHSEVSEALECAREQGGDYTEEWEGEDGKPEGAKYELADAVIRILDFAERQGFDMDAAIRRKTAYNRTRKYRHGKEF